MGRSGETIDADVGDNCREFPPGGLVVADEGHPSRGGPRVHDPGAVVEGVSIEVEEDVHNQRHRVANFMSVLYLPLDEHRVLRADHPGPW